MDTARYIEKIAVLFGKVMTSTQFDREAEDIGLTPSQLQGLSYLFHHGKSSVGDMAQGLDISHPAAVKLVSRLGKKGLVERNPSETDRRVSIVGLTQQGEQLIRKVLTHRTEFLSKALNRIDQSELETVMRGLESLLAAVLTDREIVQSACLKCGDDHIGCCVVNRTHFEVTGKAIRDH
ncbi:MAG TPA: MarR family winged helix-turn-helix transcriptional regulator [Armatimonadota bacterium]|nr:MarR family winged helix-turn-helix transcriptional regulator [Armatimonadota bacterium]HOP80416.1 MarR family winged helix-turn-helix transcriptional regulator [Armatimonadota bacterium]HPP75988.1 MarR family winged helix-turn-helix transcriptional regulator [Armatimonadota bacterium]